MTDEDSPNGRIDGRRRSAGRNLQIDDLILKPGTPPPKKELVIMLCFVTSFQKSRECNPLHPRKSGGKKKNLHHKPFSKPANAIIQISSCLEFRICHRRNGDLGKRMADEGAKVLWKSTKSVIATLFARFVLVTKTSYAEKEEEQQWLNAVVLVK